MKKRQNNLVYPDLWPPIASGLKVDCRAATCLPDDI